MYDALGDWLRELNSAHRAFLVIFIVTVLHGALLAWWGRFKHRQSLRPTQMKLRRGVYVPWGPVERIQRIGNIALVVWLFYMAVLLCMLAYMKIMGWERLF